MEENILAFIIGENAWILIALIVGIFIIVQAWFWQWCSCIGAIASFIYSINNLLHFQFCMAAILLLLSVLLINISQAIEMDRIQLG